MNAAVTVFFLIIKVFSLYFLAVSLFGLCRRRTPEPAARLRRFAVLIAARNEESCIAGLIESLRAQHYPLELVDIWVLPNNCTDRTAEAARRAGAQVLEMPASVRSKGAALHTAAKALLRSARNYDAFCVFDADNEADPAFLSEMNRALDRTAIVKSRILAKNRTQAGISACYEIYFCSANHFLNRAREAVGLSARVIGTGFAIRRDLLEALSGFPCRTLTEDAELYAACLCRGARIGYCETAVTYDEEPVTWRASLVQRRRWMSGILQVARLTLPELLTKLCAIDGIHWVRVHYMYPEVMTDELIETFAREKKLTPYFDIPIQHVNDDILKAMNRRGTKTYLQALFDKIRSRVPDCVIRTSLIAGLPGEGEAEFLELCDFLKRNRLERVGAFVYSPEEGTPAAEMPRPDEETAKTRAQYIEQLQSRIMDEWCQEKVGASIEVLCEGFDDESGLYYGRSQWDSPDIDSRVWFTGRDLVPGEFVQVAVTAVRDGELQGAACQEE